MGKVLKDSDFQDSPKDDTPKDSPQPDDVVQGGPEDISQVPVEPPKEGEEPSPEPTPKDEPTQEPQEPQFEYKSHEEAEKGAREAKQKMHTATKEAAELKKQLERYQQILKTVQPQQPAQESFRAKTVREAREKIARLDSSDSDAEQKAAEIWAEAEEKIARNVYSENARKEQEYQQGIRKVESEVKKRGFSQVVELPGVGETDLGMEAFWTIARSPLLPKGEGVTEEDQLEWIFGAMEAYNNSIIDAYEKRKAAGPQGPQDILGRKGKGPIPPKKTEERPSTLAEDAEEIRKQRVLKQ